MTRAVVALLLLVDCLQASPAHQPSPALRAQSERHQAAASPQATAVTETVRAIAPPRNPLPQEADSAAVREFSFIVYGDTRGRRDGTAEQYEHSLIVDSQLATIKRLADTSSPVRFVLQTGDAVVNGRDARQWNRSFVDLINRITTEGGVPYFLAPGNHDVTGASALDSPMRVEGLRNYLAAVGNLIPPDGASRRLDGYPTYAFGYGNAFFIALDSNIATDDMQFEWVRSQLEGLDRARYRHVIAFFHHPSFSSGPHGGAVTEPPSAALRGRYVPLFRRHRAAILFSGHDHLFEHWVERYRRQRGPGSPAGSHYDWRWRSSALCVSRRARFARVLEAECYREGIAGPCGATGRESRGQSLSLCAGASDRRKNPRRSRGRRLGTQLPALPKQCDRASVAGVMSHARPILQLGQ